jgi:hypothetical protein
MITDMTLSNQDAWAIKRALTKMDYSGAKLSPGIAMLLSSLDTSTPDGWTKLSDLVNNHPVIQEQVLKADPKKPVPAKQETVVYIPPLPKEAQLSDEALKAAENVASWYKRTVEWSSQRSPMTPISFLQVMTVWLLGLAIARRVYLELHERIYPHLYVLVVAETSKYAKSTGMNAIYNLIMLTMPHMLIPGQTSPEAMIEILSGEQPANYDKLTGDDKGRIDNGRMFAGQRGIMLDEYSSLLASSKKDYMAGFVELLMRLYDARTMEQYYTRSGGILTIKHPAISICGATTPAAMARALSNEDWENGANARYLMVFRENPLPYNPNYIPYLPPREILQPLEHLHKALPLLHQPGEPFTGHSAMIAADALEAYKRYMKVVFYDLIDDSLDDRLHGNYRRMHIQALKMAISLACMDWSEAGAAGKPTITLGHWAIAQQIAEMSRESLHRMMPVLSESRDSRTQRDLLTCLKQSHQVTIRDLVRMLGRSTKDVRSAIDVLIDSGEVEAIEHIPPGQGRKTTIYQLKVSEK